MSDCRDNGNRTVINCHDNRFLIECLQIFGRTAAPPNNQHIAVLCLCRFYCMTNRGCCPFPLYLCWENCQCCKRIPSSDDVFHILQSSTCSRSYHTNFLRPCRNRTFGFLRKDTKSRQFLLQKRKCLILSACSIRLHISYIELKCTIPFKQGSRRCYNHIHSIFWDESYTLCQIAEHHCFYTALRIL
ncbi:unknown [Ruminococcus sp. CAG:403]|nr:unknown [Ruminococcus sp. CAG:403]